MQFETFVSLQGMKINILNVTMYGSDTYTEIPEQRQRINNIDQKLDGHAMSTRNTVRLKSQEMIYDDVPGLFDQISQPGFRKKLRRPHAVENCITFPDFRG